MSKVALLKYALFFLFAAGFFYTILCLVLKKRFDALALFFIFSAAAVTGVVIDAFVIEPYWIQVRHVRIQDKALAPVLDGMRIVQITDIHMTSGIGIRERQLIRKVNALKPDILLFTGDLLDDWSQLEPAQKLLRAMKPKVGFWGVPGDTDLMVMNAGEFRRRMNEAGMDVLLDETRKIKLPGGKIFWLTGIQDSQQGNLNRALGDLMPGSPSVVIAPSPDIFEEAVSQGINLVLVGDTHGGQVGLDWLIRLSEYANRSPYMRGLFKRGKTSMYVNRGIGTKTRPIRFLCRPEIAVIEVKA